MQPVSLHSAAAGGDGVVEAGLTQGGQLLLEHVHVFQGGGGGHVAAVQQDVDVDALDALGLAAVQQGEQVVDVGMDVAVGQQAQEVEGFALLLRVGRQILPDLGLEDQSGLNGLVYQLGALGIDLAAAEGVVADLGVAHVVVGGQADGGAVGLEPGVGAGFQQLVEGGGLRKLDRVAGAAVAEAHAVHNDQYYGFLHMIFLHSQVKLYLTFYNISHQTTIAFFR